MPKADTSGRTKKQVEEEIASVSTLIETHKQEFERYSQDVDRLQREVLDLQGLLTRLRKEQKTIQRKYDDNEGLLRAVPPISQANDKVSDAKKEVRKIEKEIEQVTNLAMASYNEWSSLHGKRSMSEQKLSEQEFLSKQMDRNLNPAKYDEIISEIQRLKTELARSESENRTYEEQYKKFNIRLEDLEKQKKKMDRDRREAEQELVLAQRMDAARIQNQKLEADIQSLDKEIKDADAQREQNTALLADAQAKKQKAKLDISSYEQQLTSLQRELKEL